MWYCIKEISGCFESCGTSVQVGKEYNNVQRVRSGCNQKSACTSGKLLKGRVSGFHPSKTAWPVWVSSLLGLISESTTDEALILKHVWHPYIKKSKSSLFRVMW
jgi:hypothetical protein